MSETEINEDNCVLSEAELNDLDFLLNKKGVIFKPIPYYREEEFVNPLFQKINKLNEMAKELHARNLSVETIVKFHDIGKQAQEKQK